MHEGEAMKQHSQQAGYSIGHPWYYVLGGPVPTLKQIRALAIRLEYRGYMEADILAASKKPEPKRSETLRAIRRKVLEDLRRDISRYRKLARELRRYRRECPQDPEDYQCAEIHTGMSLKVAHLYNDFAHLNYLDTLPQQQGDLFAML